MPKPKRYQKKPVGRPWQDWLDRHPNETEAILLRVHKKGHVLRFDETTGGIKILRTKKGREKGLELSVDDKAQIESESHLLAHVLRDDDAFRRELVRTHHLKMASIYKVGSGVDLTPVDELIQRADRAGAARKPFEFMVLLLAANRKGYELIEEQTTKSIIGTYQEG